MNARYPRRLWGRTLRECASSPEAESPPPRPQRLAREPSAWGEPPKAAGRATLAGKGAPGWAAPRQGRKGAFAPLARRPRALEERGRERARARAEPEGDPPDLCPPPPSDGTSSSPNLAPRQPEVTSALHHRGLFDLRSPQAPLRRERSLTSSWGASRRRHLPSSHGGGCPGQKFQQRRKFFWRRQRLSRRGERAAGGRRGGRAGGQSESAARAKGRSCRPGCARGGRGRLLGRPTGQPAACCSSCHPEPKSATLEGKERCGATPPGWDGRGGLPATQARLAGWLAGGSRVQSPPSRGGWKCRTWAPSPGQSCKERRGAWLESFQAGE